MPIPKQTLERPYSWGEELANSLSHGVGCIASLISVPILVSATIARGTTWNVVGVSVFAISCVVLYLASTVYHALPSGRGKHTFRVVDHVAIYLLIAGTYTPFTLGVLRGGWGWTLFSLIWAAAVAGICFKVFGGFRYPRVSTVMYLAMGWLVVIAAKPMMQLVPPAGLIWLLGGGICYSGGVWFYRAEHLRYAHFVWHLFVLAGTTCHFFAVLWYSA